MLALGLSGSVVCILMSFIVYLPLFVLCTLYFYSIVFNTGLLTILCLPVFLVETQHIGPLGGGKRMAMG